MLKPVGQFAVEQGSRDDVDSTYCGRLAHSTNNESGCLMDYRFGEAKNFVQWNEEPEKFVDERSNDTGNVGR